MSTTSVVSLKKTIIHRYKVLKLAKKVKESRDHGRREYKVMHKVGETCRA